MSALDRIIRRGSDALWRITRPRVLILGAILPFMGLAFVPPEKPAPFVIRETRTDDALVCAEYTNATAPRKSNRSCVSAAQVRGWILANGRDECP